MTTLVAQALPHDRAIFIQKTYAHLAGAVAAFMAVETLLIQSGIAAGFFELISGNRYSWLLVLGAFGLLGWFSRGLAAQAGSVQTQYMGLGLYVVAEAVIFAPLIYLASAFSDETVIPTAAVLTLVLFAGLTAIVLTTGKDFSFLKGVLTISGFVALGLILCSILFGFTLGLIFSAAMVLFASAAILYDTSKVMHHYSTDQYVAASLELFASVALLFWYVLRIVMALSSRR